MPCEILLSDFFLSDKCSIKFSYLLRSLVVKKVGARKHFNTRYPPGDYMGLHHNTDVLGRKKYLLGLKPVKVFLDIKDIYQDHHLDLY